MIPPPDPEAIALADQYVPPSRVGPSHCPTAPALAFTSPRPQHHCCIPMSGNADSGGPALFPQQSCACLKPQASSRRDSILFAHQMGWG